MTDEIAARLEEIADHLVLKDSEGEARLYRAAADTIRTTDTIPANPAELEYVGDTIRDDVEQYRVEGRMDKLDRLHDEFPFLNQLTGVGGVGPKTAKRLHDTLGVETAEDIVSHEDSLTDVYGIGEKKAEAIVWSVNQS